MIAMKRWLFWSGQTNEYTPKILYKKYIFVLCNAYGYDEFVQTMVTNYWIYIYIYIYIGILFLFITLTLEEKPHFSTCLRRLKVSFTTIFDQNNHKKHF